MKTLSEKIIEQLQTKHDAFLGTKGEEYRQAFKNGLAWAIDTIETLTEIDKCEKEHQIEMKTPMQEMIEWIDNYPTDVLTIHKSAVRAKAESMLEKEMTLLRSKCDWCNGNNSPHI